MTSRGADIRPSRRSVLMACGTGLAALAGCTGVDIGGQDRDDDPDYDPAILDGIVRAGVPARLDAFPVDVTDRMIERHTDRARELLSEVPQRPDIPNGVVAERLRADREHVVEGLEGGASEEATRIGRLSHARGVRSDAAEVSGAYRAAKGSVDSTTVEEQRESLREDSLVFEADWDYRGDDPARALVVHAEIEELHRSARRNAEAWPSFPDDPTTDVFQVGEIQRNLEAGRAALSDAERLRARYLDGIDDPNSYRETFTVAAHELHFRVQYVSRRFHDFLDHTDRAEELPFDRSLDDTPARELFYTARSYADVAIRRRGDDYRRDGEYATAILYQARGLVSLRAFEAVIDAIEAGEYGRPERADRVVAERDAAVAALETAWETDPVPLSAEITWPAREALDHGVYDLERGYDARAAHSALERFAFARLYAEAVPPVVGTVTDVLEREG